MKNREITRQVVKDSSTRGTRKGSNRRNGDPRKSRPHYVEKRFDEKTLQKQNVSLSSYLRMNQKIQIKI